MDFVGAAAEGSYLSGTVGTNDDSTSADILRPGAETSTVADIPRAAAKATSSHSELHCMQFPHLTPEIPQTQRTRPKNPAKCKASKQETMTFIAAAKKGSLLQQTTRTFIAAAKNVHC